MMLPSGQQLLRWIQFPTQYTRQLVNDPMSVRGPWNRSSRVKRSTLVKIDRLDRLNRQHALSSWTNSDSLIDSFTEFAKKKENETLTLNYTDSIKVIRSVCSKTTVRFGKQNVQYFIFADLPRLANCCLENYIVGVQIRLFCAGNMSQNQERIAQAQVSLRKTAYGLTLLCSLCAF